MVMIVRTTLASLSILLPVLALDLPLAHAGGACAG